MQGKKINILLVLSFLSLFSFGQQTYKSVDSISYAMYQNQQWESLSNFGEQAVKNGFDYYYLNLRTGIAYFKLKDYNKSLLYINKSLQNNSLSQVSKEYLFWNHYYLNNEKETIQSYKELDDSIQNRMKYTPPKKIQFVYVESGIKLSDNQEVAGNILYGNIGLMHHASPKLDLYYSYTYSQQKLQWGSFLQNEIYVRPSYKLKKGWSTTLGLHYASYNSKTDYSATANYYNSYSKNDYTTDYYTTIKSNLKGDFSLGNYFSQFSIQKQWKHFSIAPFINTLYTISNPQYKKKENINSTIKEYYLGNQYAERDSMSSKVTVYTDTSYMLVNGGFKLNYYTSRFSLGLEFATTAQSNRARQIIIPSFSLNVSDKINISGYYFDKKDATFGMGNGIMLFNNSNDNQKISLTAKYNLSKKTRIYATYQYDKIVDKRYINEYKMNTIFIGLKIKL